MDRGVAAEHYFFVMEYVPGRSLRELVNRGRMPAIEALKLIAQICQAIDYAHGKQIIHRDLKPENILLDESGRVKVADFGLAGIGGQNSKHQLTATSVAMGTVNYMAPEQRRDAKHVDHRADLYSVGVMLYELVTGDLPIGRFKLPSEKIDSLDLRLDEIVSRALEPDPAARYQRASAIGADIEAVLSSSSAALARHPTTRLERADRFPTEPDHQASPSVIERGWTGIKVGLTVIGALVVLATLLKWLPGANQLFPLESQNHPSPGAYPLNTEGELFTSSSWSEQAHGQGTLALNFLPGKEELNAHAGHWELAEGRLKATQAGNQTGDDDHLRLIPRAYVAHRYFSSDDLSAEVTMQVRPLGSEFPAEQDVQHFGELAFRIKDLQVSLFAIPDAGMRLGWRYFTSDGVEQAGNSARDLEDLVADEMPVPKGPFRVKLVLRRKKAGTEVEAFVKGQRFANKLLVGLEGQTGKIAFGCRNLHCEFSQLKVSGHSKAQPAQKKVE
jgi:serine/threonine-protein kinase